MSGEEIKTLKRKRGSLKAKLTHFTKFLDDAETRLDSNALSDIDIISLETRSNEAYAILQEFDEVQSLLESLVDENSIETVYLEREEFSNVFYLQIARGKKLFSKLNATNDRNSVNSNHTHSNAVSSAFRLPPVEVPKFNGNYENWLEFKETFSSLVHTNDELREFQKFHYLKSSLLGNASQVIASIEFSEQNYSVAWDLLCERYDNTRLLVHNHVKALFNLEIKGSESSKTLRFVIDSVFKHLKALKQLGQPTEHWDTLIIYIVTSKLDNTTARNWEEFRSNKEVPTLDDLKIFLRSKADLLETLESKRGILHVQYKNSNPNKQSSTKSFYVSDETNSSKSSNTLNTQASLPLNKSCAFCKHNHFIRNCAEFLKLSQSDRNVHAKNLRLCINCLRYGHVNSVCRLSNCRNCNGRHNTLLHIPNSERRQQRTETNVQNNNSTENNQLSLTTSNSNINQSVLLATALIKVVDANFKIHTIRGMLDSASQSSFVTSKLCDKLNIKTEDIDMAVVGINNATSKISKKCEISIQSHYNAYTAKLPCLVINEVTCKQPTAQIDIRTLNIPKNIVLADPDFYKPGPVDLLIGANLFWQLIQTGQIILNANGPVLQKTTLGWVVSGCVSQEFNRTNKTTCNLTLNIEIQNQLARFWELEECFSSPPLSKEEQLCEAHFIENTKRDAETGRFIVKLPFKGDLHQLGDSETQAKRRFLSLERKLICNPVLREKYATFINEYITLGHMNRVAGEPKPDFQYYMPHHGILRDESVTTKLRVVFDASASTDSGVSLNDLQMVGPTIQSNLLDILLRFRLHKYVLTADAEKMYRQVLIAPEQRTLQRIFWRNNPDEELQTFELNTVTYGTASAPFLAIRCLTQLAQDCIQNYPDASKIITNDMYVDDLITGGNSVEECVRLGLEISNVLLGGCFKLRKWHSNNRDILREMKTISNCQDFVEFSSDQNTKTLGLRWSCDTDNFTFKIKPLAIRAKVTKRVILSCVSQIFDPLGLLAPCIIIAKIMLQKLWLERIDWDDTVPAALQSAFIKFINEIANLNNIEIKRHAMCDNPRVIELHGFSDASEQAYGACVYLRTIDENEQVHVHLLCAKSKVAPLKVITIPKLELCAAVVLTRLVKIIEDALKLTVNNVTLWTDSTILLEWLKTEPHLLKTFTANRIAEIQESTGHCEWRHVSTKDNPADLLSRGKAPSEMKGCDLWWTGPQWLCENEASWPEQVKIKVNLPELRLITKTYVVKCEIPIIDFNNFSSLNKLIRTVAFVFRFKSYLLKRKEETGVLKVNELQRAFKYVLGLSQRDLFLEEINALLNNQQIDKKSKIFSLNPFIDNDGLLRVGGRLRNSEFSYDKKHPIVVSAKHRLGKLIFKAEHLKLLHAGPQLLLSSIRETFWPISGRNLAKATVRNCTVCFRFNSKTIIPIMGDLPKNRLDAGFPFKICGVDYGGPLLIKDRKGRGSKTSKCYVALFVCFAVKSVHIELVSDLSTNAFLLALKRFIARRGKPQKIYSDNGTNFTGANAELRALGKFIKENQDYIIESCASENIEWNFIPSYSPHFGGIWEAGIKSCKHHLRRVIGNNTLTFEEMATVLIQIEAALNSRPISPLSSDPNDLNPLTPAHFLVGRPLTSTPEPDVSQLPSSRITRFQLVEQMRQNFWRRWSKEYVSELQHRVKWKNNQGELKKGSMVLIKEDNLPPLKWKLGRIIELHPGGDSVCRVASIQTVSGVTRRAFSKICPLPIDSD